MDIELFTLDEKTRALIEKARGLGASDLSMQGRADTDPAQPWIGDSIALAGFVRTSNDPTYVPTWSYLAQPQRDFALRRLWTLHGAELIQAAIAAIIQKVQSTPWYIEGPVRIARHVRDMLHNADFGGGWEQFVAKVLIDYLTQDNGAFVEVIGPGRIGGQLDKAMGIAAVDAGQCVRTGNVEYPVVYYDPHGGKHKIHWSRIWFQSDLPSPIEERRGVGFCALSRCVATAQASINWATMRNEMLDDAPASGILTINGINGQAFDEQMKRYLADRAAKDQEVYHGLIYLINGNPNKDVKVELTSFRDTWEGFKENEFYDKMIDFVTMAFGLDRQEIAPLATSSLGSGAQSNVLNQKSRGKGVGNALAMFERMINRVIPSAVKFKFDFQDDEQDKMQAEIRHMKASTIMSLYTASGQKVPNIQMDTVQAEEPRTQSMPEGLLSRAEARYLLAKEGIIPRELLQPEEKFNPGWEQFDDITMKVRQRYGDVTRVRFDGNEYNVEKYKDYRQRTMVGVRFEVQTQKKL